MPGTVHPEIPDSPFSPRWLPLGGAVLHYMDEGLGTPPILMLHGNPTWSFLYRGVVSRLRDSFRCIVPDLPGYGYSLPPPGYGFTPQEHAAWLRTLLRELGVEQFILAAQDWGGPIGLSLAVEHPERVKGLALFARGRAGADGRGGAGGSFHGIESSPEQAAAGQEFN
ncbi:MAG: alpha/beta fold hydrolase [Desulfohalobiaceae bacterium]|nr:alpha/beta fold hydrolase [Desulfohalobiaceae bacterium]